MVEAHRSQGGQNPFGEGFAPDDTNVLVLDTDIRKTWLAAPDGNEVNPCCRLDP